MVYSYLFPICCLEHLVSLRLRHAKRLMSWIRLSVLRAGYPIGGGPVLGDRAGN